MGSTASIKKRVFDILEKLQQCGIISVVLDYFLIVLILLNVVAVIIGSFNEISTELRKLLTVFEYFSIAIFTIEYLLRLWTAANKSKYIFSFIAIVDLCAILPFYLPFVVNLDLRFLRILRLFRLLRVFKLNRYFKSMSIIGQVLKNVKEKLISTILIAMLLLLLASSIMYYIESSVQPDKFPNIVATFWWAVATLTTVGYGDVYPITVLGKILSGIMAILGIGMVALPAGIIAEGFKEHISKEPKKKKICPHCGKEIE